MGILKASPRSLSKDLTLGLILIAVLVSSIAFVTAYYTAKHKAQSELQAKADEYVAFLKNTLVTPLWNYDYETINAVCRTYLQNDLIMGIQVQDRRGLLDIAMAKPKASSSFERSVTLSRLGIPIGRVRIVLTHGYISRFTRQLFGSFGLTIILNIAALALLTGIMLRTLLKRPLDRLNAVVNAYAAGHYEGLPPEAHHAEFRSLVDTLHQMGRRIQLQLTTIQKAEKKYRSIFENALEGIYQSTREGRILSANPAYAAILGYDSPEQVITQTTDIASQHWAEPADRQRMIRSILDSKTLQSFETRMVRRDGRRIWVLINGRAVYDAQGALRHIEGMVQDITHRKNAEAELRRLSAAVVQVADTIIITNDRGEIDYVNPAFETTTGFRREEVLGRQPDFLGADQRNVMRYREAFDAATQGRVWTGTFSNRKEDGSEIIMETTVSPIKSASGRFISCAAVSRDVTEKLRFEAQLRQTQKMEAIGTLAGGIAHDFNNMLGVIIGCSELAMDQIPANSLARDDLEKVVDAGMRAKALVRQILTFSRQDESEPKPLMLRPFIKEVVKFLASTLPAAVTIQTRLDATDGTVMADPTQMQQVLLNLCTNAAHAMAPGGGVIRIALTEEEVLDAGGAFPELKAGPYALLTVSDTGCGIPQEQLHRIFDPFFTTKGVGQGTGLGLSVVHGIVQGHEGGVYVSSAVGSGTTFQVLLPSLSHPDIVALTETALPLPEGSEAILVVDDEPVLGDIIKRILSGLGYRVRLFLDSPQALAFFQRDPDGFDLALLDYNIPDLNGLDLGQRLQAVRPDLPVILYTGMKLENLGRAAEREGTWKFLNKPLSRTDLSLAVRRVLDEKR